MRGRRNATTARLIPAIALMSGLAACASYPANGPFGEEGGGDVPPEPKVSYNYEDLPGTGPEESERLFVILTFSGGGTRAAALAYGVLEVLRQAEIEPEPGRRVPLLQEVDTISSISGGSYTAAYYGLNKEVTFAAGDAGFRKRFLHRAYQDELVGLLFSPANWFRLASPTFGRGDLAGEYLSDTVFDKQTYEALYYEGRPFVVLNATDITKGTPFPFTQRQFDLLCSDLSSLPVARAVMASSDFPGAFTALTLNNYPTCRAAVKSPGWIDDAVMKDNYEVNRQSYRQGKIAQSYSRTGSKGLDRPFLHLVDGGVADNLGLRPMLDAVETPIGAPRLLRMINQGKIDRIVVIAVNARGEPTNDWDRSPSPPGTVDTLVASAYNPIDQVSFDSLKALEDLMEDFNRERTVPPCRVVDGACQASDLPPLPPVDFRSVLLEFEQLPEPLRQCFYNLPTALQLPRKHVDALIAVARWLLRESPAFTAVLAELGGEPLTPPDMATIRKACEKPDPKAS